MSETQPMVSVIVPCRNEEKFIGKVLSNIIDQTFPKNKMEVLVVDGESTDNTVSLINKFCSEYSFVKLLNNPDKIVPHALNLGIAESRGEIIVRMDAHAHYPLNYIARLTEELLKNDVDNVGGVWITEAGANTSIAKAIAAATSHPFGIGNARYRLGANKPVLTDTVPFGCYKREVFTTIGLFDEQLTRNQDDEFNARLINKGGRILLVPDIKIQYFARENLTKMSKMFFQYGLFKPLVNLKLGKPASLRQLFPPALVSVLMITFIAAILNKIFLTYFLTILFLYSAAVLFFSARVGFSKGNFFHLLIVFPAIHLSYGWGYIMGMLRFVVLKQHRNSRFTNARITR